MNYKIYIYAVLLFLNIYVLSGVDFASLMKKNANIQARILVMILSVSFAYLTGNFIFDFLNIR